MMIGFTDEFLGLMYSIARDDEDRDFIDEEIRPLIGCDCRKVEGEDYKPCSVEHACHCECQGNCCDCAEEE